MKVLNLYAGIGGNRQLWDDCEVTAVENVGYISDAYEQLFPQDKMVREDAHQYLLDHFTEYDFIWSSPPCPTHSRTATSLSGWGIHRYPDMGLYQEIIFLKHFFEGPWVVENVISYYEPLITPTACLDRHYIWANFHIEDKKFNRSNDVSRATKEILSEGHGIELPGDTKDKRKLLRNAVNPLLGKHIYDSIPRQTELFGAVLPKEDTP